MASKKDYKATAEVLAGEYSITRDCLLARMAVWNITLSMADKFAQDNPRFNRELFYAAVRGNHA